MKIRIVEPGYANFNGVMAGVQFTESVAEDVTARQAALIGNVVRVENVEDGTNPSDSQALIDIQNTIMTGELERGDRLAMPDPVVEAQSQKSWTREELEAVADKEGIEGLRKIANPMNIKGTQIAKLINGILRGSSSDAEPEAAEQPAPQAE